MASLRHQQIRADFGSEVSPLSIVYRKLEELKPDPRNPRRHSKKQVERIANSIKVFGFVSPCLVDEHLRVICGHGRLAGAKLLGITRVPTVSLAHLSAEQIRVLQIADNRLAENSTWNKRILAQELQNLSKLSLDFNLDCTGFDLAEIDLLTKVLEPHFGACESSPKDPPKSEPQVAVTSPGDLWLLGNHRVICGDARHHHNYSVVTNDRLAAAVFTQIPLSANEDEELLLKVFPKLSERTQLAAFQFIVTDQRFIKNLVGAAAVAGLELADICVAVKQTAERGALYQNQKDLIFVFGNGKAQLSSKLHFERTNIWHHPGTRSRRRMSEPLNTDIIQNELPAALVGDAITDSTKHGGIVLDPFLGTGTTLIAAEQTGRICYGIESDPLLLDRALRRWQKVTGDTAVHEKCGRPFNQIGEERNGRD